MTFFSPGGMIAQMREVLEAVANNGLLYRLKVGVNALQCTLAP
jgi:hypothetical protein